jgi:hypothetical protein
LEAFIFPNTHNDKAYQVLTTAPQRIKAKQPYTLEGFEPGIFCSGCGHDDHYATPPRAILSYSLLLKNDESFYLVPRKVSMKKKYN